MMPGWQNKGSRSWGYHGDDGNLFDNNMMPREKHPSGTYGPGDVIGCGVDFAKETMFFTRNGETSGKPAAPGVRNGSTRYRRELMGEQAIHLRRWVVDCIP